MVRLNKVQLNDLIENVKANNGDPSKLEGLLREVEEEEEASNPSRAKKEKLGLKVGKAELDAKLEEAKEEAEKTEGECMICQRGPTTLYAGTCDDCFREWILATMTE